MAQAQNSFAYINNSEFTHNFAIQGGVLGCVFEGSITVENSFFAENAAINGGILYAYMNGHFVLNNVSIEKTRAVRSIIADVLDVAFVNQISNSKFTNNSIISYLELKSELSTCAHLCYIILNKTDLKNRIETNYEIDLKEN
jgi:putative ribosome biogenesis GTPase RsgA